MKRIGGRTRGARVRSTRLTLAPWQRGLVAVVIALAALGQRDARAAGPGVTFSAGEKVVPSVFDGDVSKLPQTITAQERINFIRPLELDVELPKTKTLLEGAAAAVPPIAPLGPMPGPSISFNGLNFAANGAGWPPDTVGDVGPNHFVQAVNTSIGIYNKSTGSALATFTFNTLWSGAGTGTPCDTNNNGDPTVIYDAAHDRFIVADFSWTNVMDGPYYECIAVSRTSDPVAGGWYRYAVRADDAAHPWLPDYPKMGLWPDGLYMTANMFDCTTSTCSSATYKEARAYAFNLSDLVSGAALRSVVADTNANYFSLLPSNYRGTAPPAGSPNYVVGESQTAYAWNVFKFHVDYVTPASSTFTGPTDVAQTSYAIASGSSSVPSPGVAIDTLADRAMMQAQYRNIGGVESVWVSHTTGTASAATPTGIQWAQINVTGGTVQTTPVQQQIFNNAADGLNRFMGSMAVDRVGNMAIGYSVASSTVAPDIRYAGRLATDPLNQLPQSEVTMLPGVTRSVQTSYSRWGDYSAMSVDPVDDCTFWYTNEYYAAQGTSWVTRVGSFKLPSCTPPPTCTDVDGDGYGNPGDASCAHGSATDCNDANASVNPGAAEVCNGADDNCSGAIDEGVTTTFYADADGDGYGNAAATTQACSAPGGYVANSTDCDDGNASVNPGQAEIPGNGIDDDCNAATPDVTCVDADGDGYGSPASASCAHPQLDCNDGNANVNPGKTEIPSNGLDDDCNPATPGGCSQP